MTPQSARNERLAQTIIKNLQRRHIKAYYCPKAELAVEKISELIEDGSSVTWGGTMTVRDLGIPDALRSRESLTVIDRDLAKTPRRSKPPISGRSLSISTSPVPMPSPRMASS